MGHNIAGSERLVMSLPDGDRLRVPDVGCGTGFSSAAMLRRFDGAFDGAFDGVICANQRDVDEMGRDPRAAGPGPVDVWMERRRRATHPDAFMARTGAVAGRLQGNPPGGFGERDRRIGAAIRDAVGPEGFADDYCKLFAVARRPGDGAPR